MSVGRGYMLFPQCDSSWCVSSGNPTEDAVLGTSWKDARRIMKALGWTINKAHGWATCPGCNKRKEPRDD